MTILRNAVVVGSATLLSRLLGFLRDGLVAAVLGSGPIADAFVVALRLPNLFRRLFAEGAFAAAFVPAYVALREEAGEDAARRFAGRALVVLAVVTSVLTVATWIWAEPLVAVLAPGWADDPNRLATAAALTRLTFPYLIGIAVVALLGGQLAAEKRFLAVGLTPVILNLLLIAALVGLIVLAVPSGLLAGRLLSATVAIAGAVQALFVFAVAARAGILPRLARPDRSPALRKLGRAVLPGLFAGGFAELSLVVGTMIASIEPGAVAWLYYADRLYQLPLGIVGIAIGQVLLPEITEAVMNRPAATVHRADRRRALRTRRLHRRRHRSDRAGLDRLRPRPAGLRRDPRPHGRPLGARRHGDADDPRPRRGGGEHRSRAGAAAVPRLGRRRLGDRRRRLGEPRPSRRRPDPERTLAFRRREPPPAAASPRRRARHGRRGGGAAAPRRRRGSPGRSREGPDGL